MQHHPSAQSAGHIPDDLDVYSFMFEYFPPNRPDIRGTGYPLVIDDDSGEKWSFEDMKERVDALAVGLREVCGVEWDTSVGIFSPNAVDYLTAMWASHRLGATVSAANPAFQPSELSYQLDASKATLLFVGEAPDTFKAGLAAAEKAGIPRDRVVVIQSPTTVRAYSTGNYGNIQKRAEGVRTLAGLVEEGRAYIKKNGPASVDKDRRKLKAGEGQKKLAFLSFSSGTTGLPKGVSIQHRAPIANVLQTMAFNRVTNRIGGEGRFVPGKDVSLGVLPQYHIYGLVIGVHFVFWAGITNVVVPRFKLEPMLQSIIKYKISILWLVPPQVVLLCKDPIVQKYLEIKKIIRFVMVGAAPLSDDLSKQFTKVLPGIDWGQGYGMTETCTVTTMVPVGVKSALGSAGRLFSDTIAKVVAPDGRELGIDEPGELWIKGPQCTLGYSNNAQATKDTFLPDGFVRTGDEVIINKDGDVFVVDRLKELIKVKGYQVAPAELEGWILDHPDVSDCGVVSIPDEAAGERPLAFVTLFPQALKRIKDGGSKGEKEIKDSIMKWVADNKVRYKHLRRVEIVDEIPKTASGKILRRMLRDKAKALVSAPQAAAKL